MKAKTTIVTLAIGDKTQDFEFTHAERLLRLTKAGWHIPEQSKYEFVDNAIRVKQDRKRDTRSQKRVVPANGEDTPK